MTTAAFAAVDTAALDMLNMGSLPDPIRMRAVAVIVDQVARVERRHADALLALELSGLTADRDALAAALEAKDDPSYAAAIATLATPRPALLSPVEWAERPFAHWPPHGSPRECGEGDCRRCELEREHDEAAQR